MHHTLLVHFNPQTDGFRIVCKGVFNTKIMKLDRQQTGKRGEQLAREHLLRAGYTLVACNWRCARGEIDIVAQQGRTLVFVEVRTRRGGAVAAALESITPAKREKLVELAYHYMDEVKADESTLWRIDVIAVALRPGHKPVLEHVEDALGW